MNYDYNFTKEEEILLYNELKLLINSEEYKLLRKEYNNLVRQISNNIKKTKINDSFVVLYLLLKKLDKYFYNNKTDNQLDLDILYKLWGSRVCTNDYSNRHLISFINDILIDSNFISCKILTDKKKIDAKLLKNNKIFSNDILLCLIINDKKIFIDLEEKQLLEYNCLLSKIGYNCYQKVFEKYKNLYYIKNDMFYESILEINEDHLFTMNSYYYANEYTSEDYKKIVYVKDYLEYCGNLEFDFYDIKSNNINQIALLNNELTQKQNEIYKRIKKYDR